MQTRHGPTPDLFTGTPSKAAPVAVKRAGPEAEVAPTKDSSRPRYLLPKDLAGALTRLDDSEIDALLASVTHEAKRRGRLPAPTKEMTTGSSDEVDRRDDRGTGLASRTKPAPGRSEPDADAARSLPRGQASAVRAAFMAGVKPTTIARQFGISHAAVKQALATQVRGRKS